MVFSQTSLKTQTVLKVVKVDPLKTEKNHQRYGSTGVVMDIDGYSNTAPSSPVATTSFTEVSLKSEPLYDKAMFHDSDYEFFQDLDPLCYAAAKEEVAQTIDPLKKTEEKALNIDTTYIPFSTQDREHSVANSPQQNAGYYNTLNESLSPIKYGQYENNMFSYPEASKDFNVLNQEDMLDIGSLPMVFGDLASEKVTDMASWPATEQIVWPTPDTHYNIVYTHNTTPPINMDDSIDLKFESVIPDEVEIVNLLDLECRGSKGQEFGAIQQPLLPKRSEGLSVDVSLRAQAWTGDISTPVILNDVMALEKEKCTNNLPPKLWPVQDTSTDTFTLKTSPKVDYEPITPKSESHMESDNDDSKSNTSKRRRHDSEDSDETYTPYSEQPPRKYKRRKPNVPIKDLILALESQPKARRGRPPKRRESTVSSVCSVDENSSSTSTQEFKYRELRDKNNEASKRSRMNRKVKEQQMEELAVELEEANKRLRVRVDILEEMTKKLKNELMSAILKK